MKIFLWERERSVSLISSSRSILCISCHTASTILLIYLFMSFINCEAQIAASQCIFNHPPYCSDGCFVVTITPRQNVQFQNTSEPLSFKTQWWRRLCDIYTNNPQIFTSLQSHSLNNLDLFLLFVFLWYICFLYSYGCLDKYKWSHVNSSIDHGAVCYK